MNKTETKRYLRGQGLTFTRHGREHDLYQSQDGSLISVPRGHQNISKFTIRRSIKKASNFLMIILFVMCCVVLH